MTTRMPVRMAWESKDRHRILGMLAGLGLAAAAALAIFGLPPIPLHSPLRSIGVVCPLCGGTRGMQELMGGDLGAAWQYNPIVFVVALGAAALLIRLAVGLVTGRWLNMSLVRPRTVYITIGVLVVLLWINQALDASRLTETDHGPLNALLGMAVLAALYGAGALIIGNSTKKRSSAAGVRS